MFNFFIQNLKKKEISNAFRHKVIQENSRWSLILLLLVATSQVILIIAEAFNLLPWDRTVFMFRLIVFAVSIVFSILIFIARKSEGLYKYLSFVMIMLNIIALGAGTYFVIYYLTVGNFSFTIFLMVVYLLSISYILKPCFFTVIYIIIFGAIVAHIYSNFDSSIIYIGETISAGIFLLLMAVGSSLSYSRYKKSFSQDKKIQEINRKLEMVSQTDELTGLPNRRRTIEELENQIDLSTRYKTGFTISIVDLDYFKNINDTYGHNTGDDILREFSGLLKSKLRLSDFFGRWGGEEFLLILPNSTDAEAQTLLKRLLKEINEHSFCDDIRLSFSAGICEYESGIEFNQLIKYADTALYLAKENGRSRTEIHSINNS